MWKVRRGKDARSRERLAKMPLSAVRVPSTIQHIFVIKCNYIYVCFFCVWFRGSLGVFARWAGTDGALQMRTRLDYMRSHVF